MKSHQKKTIIKTIYFTDVPNLERLNNVIEDTFHEFDRKKIIPKKKGVGRSVFNYFNNIRLEQEFVTVLKDKKVLNIVYRLHYNNPDKVLLNLRDNIIKKINNKNLKVVFKYIVRKENHDADLIQSNLYDQIIILD